MKKCRVSVSAGVSAGPRPPGSAASPNSSRTMARNSLTASSMVSWREVSIMSGPSRCPCRCNQRTRSPSRGAIPARCDGYAGAYSATLEGQGSRPKPSGAVSRPTGCLSAPALGGVFCPGPFFGRPLVPWQGGGCGLEPLKAASGRIAIAGGRSASGRPRPPGFWVLQHEPRRPGAGRPPRRVLDPTPRRRQAAPSVCTRGPGAGISGCQKGSDPQVLTPKSSRRSCLGLRPPRRLKYAGHALVG